MKNDLARKKSSTQFQMSMDQLELTGLAKNVGKSNPWNVFREATRTKRQLDYLVRLEKSLPAGYDVYPVMRMNRFGVMKYYLVETNDLGLLEDKREMFEYGETSKKMRRPITEMPSTKLLFSHKVLLETFKTTSEKPFPEQMLNEMIRYSAFKENKSRAITAQKSRQAMLDEFTGEKKVE